MSDAFYNLGKVLRTIRENKGYTQREVADHEMSRSNYTKLEKNEINPNVVKYLAILDHMDMQHDELSFILNGYKLDDKSTVLYLFKGMELLPTLSYVNNVIEVAEKVLKKREDHLTRDILYICKAYVCLLEDYDLSKARMYAENIWNRLKKLDKFYLSEWYLLNGILFYFELDTSIAMTNKALKELEKYYCFKEADELQISFLSNLSCILIAHKEYESALNYVDQLIRQTRSEYKVVTLGSALVRKGICLEALDDKTTSQSNYELAIKLFRIMERDDLVKLTLESPKLVYNLYGHVEVQETSS